MKKLQVDLAELTMAFEDASLENSYFLDLETGKVIWISGDTSRELESIYEEADEPGVGEPVDLARVLQDDGVPVWQQQLLLEADQVERLYGTRYIRVPEADSHEAYRDMEAFISTVRDERLQNRLWQAIDGRGAFGRFKDVIAGDYREQKRWYAFRDAQIDARIVAWLEEEGIEAIIPEPEPVDEIAPPEPTPRERLLAEVLAFTQAASRLPGVMRVALIGSLTTEEPDPNWPQFRWHSALGCAVL
ncbi:MAG: hypothetical protein JXA93_20230 [Anaerolineae bacterium]|nr:hypothetical protein [Anaerolineae bacterium]